MKGGGQHAAGADEDGIVIAAGKDLDARAEAADARRADEDHLHGAAGEGGFGVEDDGVILAAVGVALDVDVEYAEAALRRVGRRPCARRMQPAQVPKTGFVRTKVSRTVVEAGALEVLEEGGGLAAGEDEGVEAASSSGLRTRCAEAPSSVRRLAWTSKAPWRARTPILGVFVAHSVKGSSVVRARAEGTLAKRRRGWVSFRAGEKPRMLTLFAVAAFVISVLFAMGEVAYKRSVSEGDRSVCGAVRGAADGQHVRALRPTPPPRSFCAKS